MKIIYVFNNHDLKRNKLIHLDISEENYKEISYLASKGSFEKIKIKKS